MMLSPKPAIADPESFIRANTRLRAVPLVPEISIYVADEAVPLWQKTEEELNEDGLPPPFWALAWAGGQALARYVLDNAGDGAGVRGGKYMPEHQLKQFAESRVPATREREDGGIKRTAGWTIGSAGL